jgi:hypothetical protein
LGNGGGGSAASGSHRSSNSDASIKISGEELCDAAEAERSTAERFRRSLVLSHAEAPEDCTRRFGNTGGRGPVEGREDNNLEESSGYVERAFTGEACRGGDGEACCCDSTGACHTAAEPVSWAAREPSGCRIRHTDERDDGGQLESGRVAGADHFTFGHGRCEKRIAGRVSR